LTKILERKNKALAENRILR